MSTLQDIETTASTIGLNMLGVAAPLLAIRWSASSDPAGTAADPTEGAAGSFNLAIPSGDQWVAPAAGVLSIATPGNRILKPDGTPAPENAALFRFHGQAYLRLARLIRAVMEAGNDGLPIRPAPLFFLYSGADATNAKAGAFAANAPMALTGGTLTLHDVRGLVIDPVVVAEIFDTLLATFGVLEARDSLSAPPTPADGRQIHKVAALGDGGVRVHLVDPHGHPAAGTQLQGLEDLAADSGLFKVSTGTTSINRAASAPADLRLGAATNGKLGTTFAIPTPSKTLRRDFLRVMVADVKPFLLGEVAPTDPAAGIELAPPIRHGETVTFSFNGNAMFGAANDILTGTPADSLAVSPEIAGDFALPTDATDAQAQWPKFPAGLPTVSDPPPAGLRDNFNPTAAFITGTAADVAVTLNGLTAGQAIRVYNRQFLPDAREGRGDGAGAAVATGATSVTLRLKDPLGLVSPGIPTVLPTKPILHMDVVVVNSNKKARVFGNVTAEVAAPATPAAVTPETNLLGTAADRGISSAGILGLPSPPLPSGPFDTFDKVIGLVAALGSEGTPRDAPRLPTMARRDAMVASDKAAAWKGQVSGSHFIAAARNALQRIGSPGSRGGVEFHSISAQSSGGRLAYDIARAALRRTRNIVSRLILLKDSRWAEPAAATAGSLSGAVLQTISPITETPELAAFPTLLTSLPADWNSFVSQVLPSLPSSLSNLSNVGNLGTSPEGIRVYDEMKREFSASVHGRRDAFRALLRAIKAARELIYIEGAAFTATTYSTQLFTIDSALVPDLDGGTVTDALKTAFQSHSITLSTDVALSVIIEGSRWELKEGQSAREFQIRRDGTGVGGSLKVFVFAADDDLVTAIQNRLNAMPGLRVILCLSKNLDYGPGYEPFAAREFARRKEAVEKLLGRNRLFTINSTLIPDLDGGTVSDDLKTAFQGHSITLSTDVAVSVITKGGRWELEDRQSAKEFQIRGDGTGVGGGALEVFAGEPRVVAFHPIGFPGRALRLLTSLTVVDDVWALVGSSTIRRRGLTFDGGADLALFDTQLREGRGAAISELRRQSMAVYLGATDQKSGGPNPTFIRLLDPHTAFAACKELLDQGGAGLIEPLFDGKLPGLTLIPPSAFPSDDIADPDGRIFDPTASLNFTVPILGMIAAASGTAARP